MGIGSSFGLKVILMMILVVLIVCGLLAFSLVSHERNALRDVQKQLISAFEKQNRLIEGAFSTLEADSAKNLSASFDEKKILLEKMMSTIGITPLLNSDLALLDEYVEALSKDRDVAYAVYRDKKGNAVTTVMREPDNKGRLITSDAPIEFRGEKLGSFRMGLSWNSVEKQLGASSELMKNVSQAMNADVKAALKGTDSFIASSVQEGAVRSLVLSAISVGILALLLASVIWRMVLTPIRKITSVATEVVSSGNFQKRVDVGQRRDELGQLATAFNQMISRLNEIINGIAQQIKSNSNTAKNLSENVASSVGEMTATIEAISSTIQNVNSGVNAQAKSTEGTAETMQRMVVSTKGVSANAKRGVELAQSTMQFAREGLDASQKAVEKITTVSDASQEITKNVTTLGDRSGEIGRIVEVITSIADQTNLLALNAAIEAARAGEAGRGFAVVAEEVRKLAENSGKAADQIGKLIRSIQLETAKTVDSVKNASEQVSEGQITISKVRQALDKIAEAADQTVNQVNNILNVTGEQAQSAESVYAEIKKVAVIAVESAASTKDAAVSIKDMNVSMAGIADNFEKLDEIITALRELVQKFNL